MLYNNNTFFGRFLNSAVPIGYILMIFFTIVSQLIYHLGNKKISELEIKEEQITVDLESKQDQRIREFEIKVELLKEVCFK